MAEPITTTTTGAVAAVGIMALLIGWMGSVGADVMMVVLASIAGTFVAISGMKERCWKVVSSMLVVGIIISFVLAWSVAGIVSAYFPQTSGPYLPSTIALLLSFSSNRLPKILNALMDKAESKAGLESSLND